MVDIQVLLTTMMELFAFIVVGYILVKKHQISKETNKQISGLVVNVLSPALIVSSVCVKSDYDGNDIIWQALGAGVLLYLFLILLAKLVNRCLKADEHEAPVYELLMVFSNTAFIGYPILRVLYGDFAVFVFSLMHMPFNILIFSYGVYLIGKGSVKENQKISIGNILSMGTISSLLAIIIYMTHVNMPVPVVDFLSMLGNATIPISMIVIGASLAFLPVKEIISEKKLYLLVAIKLIVLPIILYLLVWRLPFDDFIKSLIVVSGALPSASMVVILSTEYEGDVKAASAGVFLTTLFSIITMPFMLNMLL
ncbi:AEC family transporter [Absiella sp. AM29-15]|uniref:AEC family transporter n=1 Tax=Absiella sp. AM29-15 TaxID=2292278 RepID=UPI000E40BF1A|nr:AEC family transporter [Absiella sp. AM29-15]RGC51779.1 AEC family transporter [Absiella sp. AM29-15]